MCVCVSKSKFYCVYLPSFFILSVSCVFCFNFFPDFVFIIFVISNISYVICCCCHCFVAMNLFFFSLFFITNRCINKIGYMQWLYSFITVDMNVLLKKKIERNKIKMNCSVFVCMYVCICEIVLPFYLLVSFSSFFYTNTHPYIRSLYKIYFYMIHFELFFLFLFSLFFCF